VAESADAARVYLFEYGEADDDMRAAFHIDERKYPDAAQAQAAVQAARAALDRAGVIYAVEISAPQAARVGVGVPTWEEFRQWHFVAGVPLPVRQQTHQELPPSWDAMHEELRRENAAVRDELLRSLRAEFPAGDAFVLEDSGPVRQGPASVHADEERFGFVVGARAGIGDLDPAGALASIAARFAAGGWELSAPVGTESKVTAEGHRDQFFLWLSVRPGLATVYCYSPLYRVSDDGTATWHTELRPRET
jgi:hypothetical protein